VPNEDRSTTGMRTSKFTPEQMVHVLRQGESGVPIAELCRQHQISEQTYYRWKKQFGDLGTAEVRELHQLREENRKLKKLVADLSLDKQIRREVIAKRSDATRPRVQVAWAQAAYRLSQRRACRALGAMRSSVQYIGVRPPQTALRARIREIAEVRVSYGYRRITVLLRREGWRLNAKRTYQLHKEGRRPRVAPEAAQAAAECSRTPAAPGRDAPERAMEHGLHE